MEKGFDVMASGGAVPLLSLSELIRTRVKQGLGESLKEGPPEVFPFPTKDIGF